MIARLIEILSAFIIATISTLGYAGVVLLMAIESACIPLPSGIIMPVSVFLGLVYGGQKLGEHGNQNPMLKTIFHRFDFVIGILAVLVVGWWIWRHFRTIRRGKGIRKIHKSQTDAIN